MKRNDPRKCSLQTLKKLAIINWSRDMNDEPNEGAPAELEYDYAITNTDVRDTNTHIAQSASVPLTFIAQSYSSYGLPTSPESYCY